jgi:hypothetical protein
VTIKAMIEAMNRVTIGTITAAMMPEMTTATTQMTGATIKTT